MLMVAKFLSLPDLTGFFFCCFFSVSPFSIELTQIEFFLPFFLFIYVVAFFIILFKLSIKSITRVSDFFSFFAFRLWL
jgi:hypothetical protein